MTTLLPINMRSYGTHTSWPSRTRLAPYIILLALIVSTASFATLLNLGIKSWNLGPLVPCRSLHSNAAHWQALPVTVTNEDGKPFWNFRGVHEHLYVHFPITPHPYSVMFLASRYICMYIYIYAQANTPLLPTSYIIATTAAVPIFIILQLASLLAMHITRLITNRAGAGLSFAVCLFVFADFVAAMHLYADGAVRQTRYVTFYMSYQHHGLRWRGELDAD
jgi:hypothetical protein